MCKKCNNNGKSCTCDTLSGKGIIYTGRNHTLPFKFEYGESFNDFVMKIMDYLRKGGVKNIEITVVPDPSDAVVYINGVNTHTLDVPVGSNVVISVSKSGYITETRTFVAPTNDETIVISLAQEQATFDYYWGEIGNIFAPEPSSITQENWTNQISPDGTSGGMTFYENQSTIPDSIERVATGANLQWWILLVPSEIEQDKNYTDSYSWDIYDELIEDYVSYDGTVYKGSVELDGVLYSYSAIRPATITKIKMKNG